jgi:arginyl-tRNA synthetase
VLEAPKGKTPEDWEPVELPLFRSTKFGDDQDRPIRKRRQLDLFRRRPRLSLPEGAERRRAGRYLGRGPCRHGQADQGRRRRHDRGEDGKGKPFEVKLVQMVQLLKGGEPFKMSKRAGNFVTLADVVEMVGKDVVRFTMLTRKPEAQMDFDFDKVVEASKDNPVFYVQYAHARIRSTLRKAAAEGFAPADGAGPAGRGGRAGAGQAGRAVPPPGRSRRRRARAAPGGLLPHDLAAAFHAYWNLGNDRPEKRFIVAQDVNA